MMKKDQLQHRIPQVYLRLWSFKDKSNADTLCVLKKGDPVPHRKHVKKFTAEINLFDTTIHDAGFERFFDEKCKYVETNYPKVVSALTHGTYSGQTRIYLTEFTSNLFVRQRKTFEFLTSIIDKEYLRNKFLNEFTILEDDDNPNLIKAVYEEISIDIEHTIDSRVSAVILPAWKHFNKVIGHFNHVILKAPQERAWFTSDNPVIVHWFGVDGWILGPDAEVYFPISKEYLVYMFSEKLEKSGSLRSLPFDQVSDATIEIFDDIMFNVIGKQNPDYAVLGEDLSLHNLETGELEKVYRPVDPREPHEHRKTLSLMNTIGPPALDNEHLESLLVKMDAEFEPVELKVETHPNAKENECISIVDQMIQENGGKRILGWQLWESAYILEAEFHVVWETVDGTLKDISRKKEGITYIVFVEDERLVYKNKQMDNIRLNIFKIPLVEDFIECCKQVFRLMNKGERSLLYGQDLANRLTRNQLDNIERVTSVKTFLWQFLESGGKEDYLCPCKSGRKYMNCHHKIVQTFKRLD